MMRRMILLAGALSTVVALAMVMAVPASAVPAPKTTGSVGLSTPTQYLKFNAFETAPVKGTVDYTNFEFATPGTGVWAPANTFDIGFYVDGWVGGPYVHRITVTPGSLRPTSPTFLWFNGTGEYLPDSNWTDTFTGTLAEGFSFTLMPCYAGGFCYTLWGNADGFKPDGSISGTWSDTLSRTGTFDTSAGAFHEVFHYVADVTAADITGPSDANFSYVIPAGLPYGGLEVPMQVHDGGSPGAGNDTISWFGHYYTIVSGNLTVFD